MPAYAMALWLLNVIVGITTGFISIILTFIASIVLRVLYGLFFNKFYVDHVNIMIDDIIKRSDSFESAKKISSSEGGISWGYLLLFILFETALYFMITMAFYSKLKEMFPLIYP